MAVSRVAIESGLPSDHIRLLCASGHLIFSVSPSRVIARACFIDEGYDLESTARELKIASLFDGQIGSALPRQPKRVDNCIVTLHTQICGRKPITSAEFREAGQALLGVHERLRDSQIKLPVFTAEVDQLIALLERGYAVISLPIGFADEMRGLAGLILSFGHLQPVHGDPNEGNILIDQDGRARWFDWECTCLAPLEWDGAVFPLFLRDASRSVSLEILSACQRLKQMMYVGWSAVHPVRSQRG